MYSLNMPVSAIRTKIRQEFEQHRYVNQLNVVDVLIQKSNAEFQVSRRFSYTQFEEDSCCGDADVDCQYPSTTAPTWAYFPVFPGPFCRIVLALHEFPLWALTDVSY